MISPPLYYACHYSYRGKEVSVFKLPERREMIDAQQASCSGSEMFCSSMLRGLFLLHAHLCIIRQKHSGAVILMAQILTLITLIPVFFFFFLLKVIFLVSKCKYKGVQFWYCRTKLGSETILLI